MPLLLIVYTLSCCVTVSKAIHAINAALLEGGAEDVLAALKEPLIAIRSITDECATTYQAKLVEAIEEKAQKGIVYCLWSAVIEIL